MISLKVTEGSTLAPLAGTGKIKISRALGILMSCLPDKDKIMALKTMSVEEQEDYFEKKYTLRREL